MTRDPSRTIVQHTADALALVRPTAPADTPLEDAVGAVLAADVVSTLDAPAFDASAMDGYAVRAQDVAGATPSAPVVLRVVGDVAAGDAGPPGLDGGLGPGEAVRIMTGAPVPPGADAVVPVERTSTGRFTPGAAGSGPTTVAVHDASRTHVRTRGEDVRRGDVVVAAGAVLTARHVSVAASAGHATVRVHRAPRVAVLSTGSELVAPGTTPGPGHLPDSNSVLLAEAARTAGAHVVRRGAVGDSAAALVATLDGLLDAFDGAPPDLLVSTGGVSAGAFDVVREVLDPATRAGTPWQDAVTDARLVAVGMQPGRPQGLGRWRGVPWLALPGNPVSAYVSFELFVRPVVDRLRGVPGTGRPLVRRVAAAGWSSPPGREQLVLVRHTEPDGARVVPAGRRPEEDATARGSGSHRLSALAHADALAVVGADVTAVAPGDPVQVLLL
ncbi:gephyrin-like molybdotransferase Glp [Cellulosimicrobium sp. 4261]|uniref:molybdopterin molybdotransferase MoeA n=1 Tax=Cellulosimicrobium sp. 4261 TaxID=3156458 RepID=UPI003390EAD8